MEGPPPDVPLLGRLPGGLVRGDYYTTLHYSTLDDTILDDTIRYDTSLD